MKKNSYKLLFISLIIFCVFYYQYSGINIKDSNYMNEGEIDIPSINVNLAWEKYKINSAVFIDSRDKRFYDRERIKGALSFPFTEHYLWKDNIIIKINMDQEIIVYCDTNICSMSFYVAKFLKELGYTNVYKLVGGIDKWIESGYPVQSSY